MYPYKGLGNTVLLAGSLLLGSTHAEEVQIDHQGIQLRADMSIADGKSLDDGVVLLLHGTLAHNRMEIISTVSELLNDTGYNTLAINLGFAIDKRPSAMLDCTIDHHHKHEDAVGEMKAWSEWLKEQGASKIAVWGHSRGGNQTACFVHEHTNDLISDVILVAPGSLHLDQEIKNYKEKFQVSLTELIDQSKTLIDADKSDELMEVPRFVYCENAKASAAAFYSYLEDTECRNTPKLLETIAKPTLVITGSEDDVVADLPEQLAELKNNQVSIQTIEGAGHFFRDLNADEMVEMIDDFLGW